MCNQPWVSVLMRYSLTLKSYLDMVSDKVNPLRTATLTHGHIFVRHMDPRSSVRFDQFIVQWCEYLYCETVKTYKGGIKLTLRLCPAWCRGGKGEKCYRWGAPWGSTAWTTWTNSLKQVRKKCENTDVTPTSHCRQFAIHFGSLPGGKELPKPYKWKKTLELLT